MRTVSIRQFRDRATKILRSEEAILVTRHGKETGIYIPLADIRSLSPELRWKIFDEMTSRIKEETAKSGVSENEILREFERSRRTRSRQQRDNKRPS